MSYAALWLDASKLQIKIAGTVVSTVAGTLKITNAIGQRSTCTFTVIDPTGVVDFYQGMPVDVRSSTDVTVSKRLFAGIVMTSKRTNASWTSSMLHDITCADWHYLADKRIAATTYVNQTAGFIANDLIQNWLSAEDVLGLVVNPALTRATTAYYALGTTDPFVGSVSSGTARYEAGGLPATFAIKIEATVTNLLSANQSDVETNTTGFAAAADNILAVGATITRDTAHKYAGTAALKIVTTNALTHEGADTTAISASALTSYTASVELDGTNGQQWEIVLRDNTNAVQAVATVTCGSDWTRGVVTLTTGASAVTDLRVGIRTNAAVAQTVWTDGWQIEQRNHPTSWQVGGTTRNKETIQIPTAGTLNYAEGTIQFRAFIDQYVRRQATPGNGGNLFGIDPAAGGGAALNIFHSNNTANWVFQNNGSFPSFSDSLIPDGWHKFAVAWDVDSAICYVDGAEVARTNSPTLQPFAQWFYLGSTGAGSDQANTLYQDVRFSARKRTAAELAADAALTSFLPGDTDTTYLARFNGALVATSPNVLTGPVVPSFLVNYVPVAKAMDDLCTLVNFVWQIDANRLEHFAPATTYPAPWTYDGTMGLDVSFAQSIEEMNPLYRNGQWILGIPDVTSTQVETRKGDGANQVWPMSYPLHSTPTITVNAVSKTVGIGQVDTGKDFYWNKGKNEVFQDSAGTKLISTDTLSVTYIGEWTSNVYAQSADGMVNQLALEKLGTGLVEEAHSESAITTVTQGFALAAALLTDYGLPGRQVEFTTLQSGLAPQQLLTIMLPPSWNMDNAQALIESVDITENGVYWLFTVKAIVGPVNDTWVQYLQRIANPLGLDSGSTGSGSTVGILVPETAAWNWAATYTATVTSCPVFPITLTPATLC